MEEGKEKDCVWSGFAASVPGSGHIRYGIPCQDASAVMLSPRPALIVCDGRGSAQKSHFGARKAVEAFQSQCAILEPHLASVLDREREDSEASWQWMAQFFYRTLMQVKLDLAQAHGLAEREFDFTVALAIAGKRHIGCFQVGDGAIVLRQAGQARTAFLPDKGDFANQTHFLRQGGERGGKFHAALFDARENSGIAITSDGPEYLMFDLRQMTPSGIFEKMFDALQEGEMIQQDLMDYLTRVDWNKDPRGADDRSIALLVPSAAEAPQKPGELGDEAQDDVAGCAAPKDSVTCTPVETECACRAAAPTVCSEMEDEMPESKEPAAEIGFWAKAVVVLSLSLCLACLATAAFAILQNHRLQRGVTENQAVLRALCQELSSREGGTAQAPSVGKEETSWDVHTDLGYIAAGGVGSALGALVENAQTPENPSPEVAVPSSEEEGISSVAEASASLEDARKESAVLQEGTPLDSSQAALPSEDDLSEENAQE